MYARMRTFFSAGLLLCLTGLRHGKVILVAPGSDVSEKCEGTWDGIRTNDIQLKIDSTAHLLVQNFQDKRRYTCGDTELILERRHASSGDATLLYRAVGQSVHLFCKHLGAETYSGEWSWKHGSFNRGFRRLSNSSEPFTGPVSKKGGGDNDFSLDISSVEWGDSGQFQCTMRLIRPGGGPKKQTSYELVVVQATAEPQHVYEGGSVTLCCSVSLWKTPWELCWIHLDSNSKYSCQHYSTYPNRCKPGGAAVFNTVSIVSSVQSQWACAVFHGGTLRALLPVQLNVSKHTTTHTPPTHTTPVRRATTPLATHSENAEDTRNTTATQHTDPSAGVSVPHVCVMSVFGLVVVILVALTALLLWKRTDKEVCEDEDERRTADEEACAEGLLPHRGSVTYASVHFKRKPTEDLSKDVAPTDPPATAGGTEGEDVTVIYAGLKMNSCS
ncbi:hypothetical protein AALO_G00032980 [Alosa alosa]|uniref:Ig-like domain-containing protein n=1 Tax=Alosa alosa TaxID=278164 RepID=A0AAV6HCJ7_9TELE|nr:uncharacterized protein LOC125290918 isoform X1 [Alosa alosa]KAG5285003.1 hypothetical protein AALO_G00032980 [Alosa alosa]